MARPTSRADASLTAPTTWISTSFDAPSPSVTIARASVRATASTASSNCRANAPSRAGSIPAAPLASSSAVSFVLVSPSTEMARSEEHTSELQSRLHLVCRLLLEKKKKQQRQTLTNQQHTQ